MDERNTAVVEQPVAAAPATEQPAFDAGELPINEYREYKKDPEAFTKKHQDQKAAAPKTEAKTEPKGPIPYDRFNEVVIERNKLRERMKELEAGTKPAAAAAPKTEAKPAAGDGKPEKPDANKFEDFDKYEAAKDEYFEKLADWKVEQRERERTAKETERKQAEEESARAAKFQKSVQEARTKYADYDTVIKSASDANVPVSDTMLKAMMRSDRGADLFYYFGKNHEEAGRIASMDPIDAIEAIALIKASLGSTQTESAVESKAPAPITPVRSAGTGTPRTLSDARDQQDYQRMRKAQLEARR